MKGISKMISSREKVELFFRLEITMKENFSEINSKGKAFITVVMGQYMREIGKKGISMAASSKNGQMELGLKGFVSKERKVVSANKLSLMGVSTKGNIFII